MTVVCYRPQLRKPDKIREVIVRDIVMANIGRIVKLLTRFLFLAHWVACIWWVIGAWGGEDELAKPLSMAANTKTTYWPIRPNAKSIRLDWNSTFAQQYLSSMYWSLSTLMKTAWIPPVRSSQ